MPFLFQGITYSMCSSWLDKPGNLPKKEEITLLESGSWLRRRRDHKAMSDSSEEENWMGSPPHMALLSREDPSRLQFQG